jgi:hypothetical protein
VAQAGIVRLLLGSLLAAVAVLNRNFWQHKQLCTQLPLALAALAALPVLIAGQTALILYLQQLLLLVVVRVVDTQWQALLAAQGAVLVVLLEPNRAVLGLLTKDMLVVTD